MYLAIAKHLHAFIWEKLPIKDQVISRVNDFSTKEKHPEMTMWCPIFEWIPGISITYKDNETQIEEDEIYSTHEDEHDD